MAMDLGNLGLWLSSDACLAASPHHRQKLKLCENKLAVTESQLNKIIKATSDMQAMSQAYGNSVLAFVDSLQTMANDFGANHLREPVSRFVSQLQEAETQREMLIDQAKMTVSDSLNDFVQKDLKTIKDTGKLYTKLHDEVEVCRSRFAATPKSKHAELLQTRNLLVATEAVFLHTSLDYSFKINVALSKRESLVCERVLAFMYAQNMFYLQGTDGMNDMDPVMKQTALKVEAANKDLAIAIRVMELKHAEAQSLKPAREGGDLGCTNPDLSKKKIKAGFLFRRESNTFRSWTRLFFRLKNGSMVQTLLKSKGENKEEVVIEDLRLCTPKSDPADVNDRQHCFELISPMMGSVVLQALSRKQRDYWIAGIQDEIEKALNKGKPDKSSTHSSPAKRMISSIKGNSTCADCNSTDPTWCSINLGITLCIECSGIHRSMGVHISKVRSLTLDKLDDEVSQVMARIGNHASNEMYLTGLDVDTAATQTPSGDADRSTKEEWIRKKYVEKAFIAQLPLQQANEALIEAASTGVLLDCVRSLMSGADPNVLMPSDEGTLLPLVAAVKNNHIAVAGYLILNQADINLTCGTRERSAIHYAALDKNVEMVHMLIKCKADLTVEDSDGNNALAIALDAHSADTVTLLRLAALEIEEGCRSPDSEWVGVHLNDFGPMVLNLDTNIRATT
eukprot:m.111445 g.111445  ORF g.111445 m.111445 type:complete len:679 (+) comp28122_c0_seq2:168-2204(+)